MKGMSKIKRGVSFRGVSSYVIDRDDPEKEQGQIVGGNMTGTTPAELTEEFEISHTLRPEIEKPVWHNSLRLPEKEKISDEKWKQIGDDYMDKMGFSEMHPRVYVKHDDQEGQHIHIVASRVALDGEIYLGRNENLQSTKHIHNLEREHDLIRTKSPEHENGKVVIPDVKQLKKGEIEKANREEERPSRMKIREYIDDALKEKCTAVEFCERLEMVGVRPCPNIAKNGTLNGFSFECEGVAFKGSQLGNNYKMAKLQERGLEYEQVRDCKELTDRKERFSREFTKNRGIDQGDTSPSRGDSKRSITFDRIGNRGEEKCHKGDSKTRGNNGHIRDFSRVDKEGETRNIRARSASEKSEKSPTNNLVATLSSDSSGSDRGELGRSWKRRFRAIDSTVSSAKRQQHIQRNNEQSNEKRNRPSQRDFTKKVELQQEGTRNKKIIKSPGTVMRRKKPQSLDDDYGLSM